MTEGIRITTGEEYIEDSVSRNVLEKQFVTNMSGETPSVKNRKFFVGVNTSPVNVTDFLYGAPGQRIYILGDGNMTIKHGTFIFTNTGADKLLAADKVYRFTYFETTNPKSHKWVEDE